MNKNIVVVATKKLLNREKGIFVNLPDVISLIVYELHPVHYWTYINNFNLVLDKLKLFHKKKFNNILKELINYFGCRECNPCKNCWSNVEKNEEFCSFECYREFNCYEDDIEEDECNKWENCVNCNTRIPYHTDNSLCEMCETRRRIKLKKYNNIKKV